MPGAQVVAGHPSAYLRNVSPLLKACNDDLKDNVSSTRCKCTDPSYGYTTPCKITSATDDHTNRSHCYFGKPGDNKINPSIGGSLVSKPGTTYSVKTQTQGKQLFTTKGTQNMINNSAKSTYPLGFLFCQNPTDTTGAFATPSKPNLTYNSSNTEFTGWATVPTKNKSANLGFDSS